MNKNLRVSIPEPCHEDWNKMTPAEKGRFCGSCEKVVMDFTSMSDAQIIAYFKQENRSTCGHFHHDQLNRDMNPARKGLPWVKYFFQIAIPALFFSYRAVAQGKPKVLQDTIQSSDINIRGRVLPRETRTITGQVTDLNGVGIPFATVMWDKTSRGVQADSNGRFVIEKKENDRRFTLSAVGFYSQTVDATIKNTYTVQLVPADMTFDGVVVVTTGIYITKPEKPMPLLKRFFSDTASKFVVYPNPVSSGSAITVDWKKEEGDYSWELTDVAGRVVTTGKVSIGNKVRSFTLNLPSALQGTYILTFLGKKGKAYSEKIIIK